MDLFSHPQRPVSGAGDDFACNENNDFLRLMGIISPWNIIPFRHRSGKILQ
jgi:hypothetical protein